MEDISCYDLIVKKYRTRCGAKVRKIVYLQVDNLNSIFRCPLRA